MDTETIKSALDQAILESGDRMLPHFRFSHLPEKLATASARFASLAIEIIGTQPATAERTVCLRKLLEAKDCAVRNLLES